MGAHLPLDVAGGFAIGLIIGQVAVAGIVVGALGVWMAQLSAPGSLSSPAASLSSRSRLDYPTGGSFHRRTTLAVAFSPDGSSVVFHANNRLWRRIFAIQDRWRKDRLISRLRQRWS